MELNRKILKFGLIATVFLLIISLGFAFSIKLDRPVFLKSLIEERVSISKEYYHPVEFRIRYISNAHDNRQINYIEFLAKDYTANKIFGNVLYSGSETYGPYNINTVHIEIHGDNIPRDLDRLEINKGKTNFNNGDTMEVDLGRIILHSRYGVDNYVEFSSGGSSSDGTSSSTGTVKEDISLIDLESLLFEEAKDLYDIKINGISHEQIQGMNFKEGDILRVNSLFKTPENILDKYTKFELQPRLYFKDTKENISYINIFNIRYEPYKYDFRGILEYLKARGEI